MSTKAWLTGAALDLQNFIVEVTFTLLFGQGKLSKANVLKMRKLLIKDLISKEL